MYLGVPGAVSSPATDTLPKSMAGCSCTGLNTVPSVTNAQGPVRLGTKLRNAGDLGSGTSPPSAQIPKRRYHSVQQPRTLTGFLQLGWTLHLSLPDTLKPQEGGTTAGMALCAMGLNVHGCFDCTPCLLSSVTHLH